jgi:hypothetical protein
MALDWKAACRRRGKAQRRDKVWHDVAFDVVAMQMDLQWFVRAQTDYDLIVLANRQHWRVRGRSSAMNFEFENALFRVSISDRSCEQRSGQQGASRV